MAGTSNSSGAAKVVPVRLGSGLLASLDARAEREGISRSELIRSALDAYLGDKNRGQLVLTPSALRSIAEISERFGVQRLEVFGSFARGEATAQSDVDLLYTLKPGVRLGWGIEELASELTEVLGRPVDLVSRRSLRERIRDDVFEEAEVLYAS